MLRRFSFGLLATLPSYFIGFAVGMFLIAELSHTQDKSVEAAMTGAFVFGPVAALLGFVATSILIKPKRPG